MMNSPLLSVVVRRAAVLLAALIFFSGQAAALACEGCKSSMSAGTAAEEAGLGFAMSTYTMLTMPFLLVGAISVMGYRNIRKIDQIRQAEADELTKTDRLE